jgi:ribonuclease Z
MATLYLLGTGAAVSDPHRTTTMLALSSGGSTLVIDCGGDVVQRLLAASIDLDSIAGLIITHEHPDHAGGFPLFMEKIWLAGRRRPIAVYGIAPAIRQARIIYEAFNTSTWTGMPSIDWHEIPYEADAPVLENTHWSVTASPVKHAVPTVGLRFLEIRSGAVVAYSCDTEPTGRVVDLAANADILIHEATGDGPGHTGKEDAAKVAYDAGAKRLILVHLPPGLSESDLADARKLFPNTDLGEELGEYSFGS